MCGSEGRVCKGVGVRESVGVRGECVRGWECERVCGSEGRVCKGVGV